MSIPSIEEAFNEFLDDYKNGRLITKYHDENSIYFVNPSTLQPHKSTEGNEIQINKKQLAELLHNELGFTAQELEDKFKSKWTQSQKPTGGNDVQLMNYDVQQYINTLKV